MEQLPSQESHSIEETLERLLAAARGEVDAYMIIDPYVNTFFIFADIDGEPPTLDEGMHVSKINTTEALEQAHDIAQDLLAERQSVEVDA